MANITTVMGKNSTLKNTIKNINGAKVEIKDYLDVETITNIVQTVSQTCFQNGEFHAENREIARRFAILKYLTDIEVKEEEISEVFRDTQAGNWFSQIENDVTRLPLWGEVETAIDNQITYLLSKQTAFDKLCADLSAMLSVDTKADLADVKEVLEKLDKVDKQEFVEAVVEQSAKKTKKK
jgi:histidyl-tRNA synthetase